MKLDRGSLYMEGVKLAQEFCDINDIRMPLFNPVRPGDRYYGLGTCAYYRPESINVMIEKCARPGTGGRCWSWPGYVIDRTPFGVVQHELGHHVDYVLGNISKKIYMAADKEEQLTGYTGTDNRSGTFFMEWFAENFRLFVTNPYLASAIRPKFYKAIENEGLIPITRLWNKGWLLTLAENGANDRITKVAQKKIDAVINAERKQLQFA